MRSTRQVWALPFSLAATQGMREANFRSNCSIGRFRDLVIFVVIEQLQHLQHLEQIEQKKMLRIFFFSSAY